MEIEVTVIFKGKVQGVLFRSSVRKIANEMGLHGYAKNLDDLSVEVRAVGEKSKLDEFIRRILKDPGKAEIKSYDTFFSCTLVDFHDFSIV